jgi:hypothetical protein
MLGLYLVAKFSNADISFLDLLKLKFKGIDTTLLVRAMVMLKKSGIDISKEEVLQLIKDNRNVMNITNFLVVSKKLNLDASINEAIIGDKLGIDFIKELSSTENIQEKFKQIKNKILLNN